LTHSSHLSHRFVEFIPEKVEEATIYVSIEYATATHLCCCGCGYEIVTPISPTGWSLTFDGESISLNPSIGNWSLPWKSHYWIRSNRVRWAKRLSREEIEAGRAREKESKEKFFQSRRAVLVDDIETPTAVAGPQAARPTLLRRMKHYLWPTGHRR
jgi:hypothetical protein